MAKKKFGGFRRARVQASRLYRRASRRTAPGKASLVQPDAMIYGAGRQYLAQLISPLTDRLPLGTLSDEVGMAVVDYMLAKSGKGLVRNIAIKGLIIENAAVGAQLASGGFGINKAASGEQYRG